MFQNLNIESDIIDANENYFGHLMSMLKWMNWPLLVWAISRYV